MTIFIKINETECLNIKAIQSFTASEWEKPNGLVEQYDHVAFRAPETTKRETVLTIVRKDRKQVTLCGASADAALAILHQHGF